MAAIEVNDIVKRFGTTIALNGVNLKVKDGELFALLGPSGCGKTTLLRVIAGFEIPDKGRVLLDGRDVTLAPPDARGTVMVFQNWALWPHMTVYENIAFGLKLKKLPEVEIKKRVKWVLELLGLEGFEKRLPGQLSGGQQQRVALARALAVEPKVLLLDEPLSNLDAKLRLKLRGEIRKLQRQLRITTIYVTHDQEEAMSLADRIALMRNGIIEQIGTPSELYTNPQTFFTAMFLGRTSIAIGKAVDIDGDRVIVNIGEIVLKAVNHGVSKGDDVGIVIKADGATMSQPKISGYEKIIGIVTVSMYLGSYTETRILIPGTRFEVILDMPPNTPITKLNEKIIAYIPSQNIHAYPLSEDIKEFFEEM